MTTAEPPDRDRLRDLLGTDVRTIQPLGSGLDNRAYEINGDLVVRIAGRPDPESTRWEAGILRAVRAATCIAVPEPVVVVPEAGLMAYPKLPGVPLAFLPEPTRIGPDGVATLERFRRDIQALRTPVVDVSPAWGWLAEAAASYAEIAPHVPGRFRRPIEDFLTRPGPAAGEPVFCHNDLGTEHVLVDPGTRTVTGVIDWTDAAMADPDVDLGRLHRDLGPQVTPTGPAVFYARCLALEDLLYGVTCGRETYRRNALHALTWLYPA